MKSTCFVIGTIHGDTIIQNDTQLFAPLSREVDGRNSSDIRLHAY